MCKIITRFLWKVFVLPPPVWEADREPVHQNCIFRWGNDISLWRTTQYYVLFSTSNWNVLVKFQWLLEDGDLTQLNCLSFCLLALGPMAVIPCVALGELRSLCGLCFVLRLLGWCWVLGWAHGLDHCLGVWQGPVEWKCKWKMTVMKSRLFFSHLSSVLGHVLLCADHFMVLLFFPLYFHMLVMYWTAGGDWLSAFGSVDVSLYWYLEGLSRHALEASLNLFFFSRAQKLSPINNAADIRKKLEL